MILNLEQILNNTSDKDELLKLLNEYIDQADEQQLTELVFITRKEEFKRYINLIVSDKFTINGRPTESLNTLTSTILGLHETVCPTIVRNFLIDCCNGGVIDLPTMLSCEDGLYRLPIKNNAYRPIVDKLLNLNLGGQSAVGRAELGLAFMGINTIKDRSDITVSLEDIPINVEIKASKNRSDFFMKIIDTKSKTVSDDSTYMDGLKLLIDAVNSVGGEFNYTNSSTNCGISQLNPKTVTMLNYYFKKLGHDAVYQLLINILNANYNEGVVSNYSAEIKNCISQDGTVIYDSFKVSTSKINFDYYKSISNHNGVLMINLDNLTFSYQKTAEGFAKLIEKKIIVPISAIDFRGSSHGCLSFKFS